MQAYGTHFVASRWLLEAVLKLVENRKHSYITGLVLSQADAIAAVPLTTFQVALAIHGDPTGQRVEALVRFLRQGDVLLVDADSISA